MNVVLISPPSRIMNHYRPPLALMYLAGFLKKNDIAAEIIDIVLDSQIRDASFYKNKQQFLQETEKRILERVASRKADIIGITCYTPEFFEAEQLAVKIRDLKPKATIIAGGIHPTLYPNDFLKKESVLDAVIIGEGELTLLEFVRARSEGRSFKEVKGIGYFDQADQKVVITDPQPLAPDLDKVCIPDYDDLDMDYYTTASPYAIRGVFTRSFYLSSSRGCPSSCTFCVSKKLRDYHGIKNFVRLRSPDSLYQEIQTLRDKHHIDSFYFIDDLFTLRKQNIFEFCELMVKSKSSLIWGCSSKVNTVDFPTLKAMRDAGCVQIDFGVEKGTDEALKKLKKGITIAQIQETFRHCHKLGIRTFANMLVNTPGETEQDLKDICALVEEIRPQIVSFNIFTPYPGCEIYELSHLALVKDDYPLLMRDPAELVQEYPEKFRFASHGIDFRQWVPWAMRKYNQIVPNMTMFFNSRYAKSLIFSGRKLDYVHQTANLFREVMVQKF